MFQTVMVHKLRKNGFSAVDSSDEHPDTINTKENKLPGLQPSELMHT
jgi:hypothetical protein